MGIQNDFIHAELRVADYYQRGGWKLLKHQYRCIGSELDLIVIKKRMLVVVEVKLRKKWLGFSSEIEDVLGYRKYQALYRGLQHFLANAQVDYQSCRIDLAVVKAGYSEKMKRERARFDDLIIYQDVR